MNTKQNKLQNDKNSIINIICMNLNRWPSSFVVAIVINLIVAAASEKASQVESVTQNHYFYHPQLSDRYSTGERNDSRPKQKLTTHLQKSQHRNNHDDDDDNDNDYTKMMFPPPWITIRSVNDYLLTKRLGYGKFSDVFEAIDIKNSNNDKDDEDEDDGIRDVNNDEASYSSASSSSSSTSTSLVVLKCLKPTLYKKVRREVLILHRSEHIPNIVRLKAIVMPNTPTLTVTSTIDKKKTMHETTFQEVARQKDDGDDDYNTPTTKARVVINEKDSTTPKAPNYQHPNINANYWHTHHDHHDDDNDDFRQMQKQHLAMPTLVLEHAGKDCQFLGHPHWYNNNHNSNNNSTSSSSSDDGMSDLVNVVRPCLLTDYEIRFYLYQLLIALDGLHTIGIMHRDVKPRNVLINRHVQLLQDECYDNNHPTHEQQKQKQKQAPKQKQHDENGSSLYEQNILGSLSHSSSSSRICSCSTSNKKNAATGDLCRSTFHLCSSLPKKPLVLIDMGLAEFYIPGTTYNVRVASRPYKSPELLCNYMLYGPSVDMWSFGCLMAGLLLDMEPIFNGIDNTDQLGMIVSVLGLHDFFQFVSKYNITISPVQQKQLLQVHEQELVQKRKRRGKGKSRIHQRRQLLHINPTLKQQEQHVRYSTTVKIEDCFGRVDIDPAPSTNSSSNNTYKYNKKLQRLLALCRRRRGYRFHPTSATATNDDHGALRKQILPLPLPRPDALDLLDKLLEYDPEIRYTAKQAMEHPFFDPVRAYTQTNLSVT